MHAEPNRLPRNVRGNRSVWSCCQSLGCQYYGKSTGSIWKKTDAPGTPEDPRENGDDEEEESDTARDPGEDQVHVESD